MILVMLNQRWVFKNATYKNLEKFVWKEKVGRLISESKFVVFNSVIIRNIVQNLCSVYLSRKISTQKEEEKERTKEYEKA